MSVRGPPRYRIYELQSDYLSSYIGSVHGIQSFDKSVLVMTLLYIQGTQSTSSIPFLSGHIHYMILHIHLLELQSPSTSLSFLFGVSGWTQPRYTRLDASDQIRSLQVIVYLRWLFHHREPHALVSKFPGSKGANINKITFTGGDLCTPIFSMS